MDEDIKKILEENLKLTQEIHKMTKHIKRYVVMSQIMGVFKLILIIVPIILGFLYLPPLFKNAFQQYQELLDLKSGLGIENVKDLDVNNIKLTPELLKILDK